MNEPLKSAMLVPVIGADPAGRRSRAAQRSVDQRERLTSIPAHYPYLFIFGIIALIFYYVIADPNNANLETRSLSSLVLVVSCLPMILFLFRGKIFQIPALEAHGLFYAMSFGFAGFLPVPSMGGAGAVTESAMDTALATTLVGLMALLAGYYFVGPKLMNKVIPIQADRGFSLANLEFMSWTGCVLCAILSVIARHIALDWLTQVSIYTYSLGFYLLLVLALDKRISGLSRLGVFCLLFPYQVLFNSGLGGGQLAGVVCLVCWVSLVILRCWRHIPVYLLAGAFLFFIIFQPVKFYVRNMVAEGAAPLGPVALVQAYGQGFLETYGSSHEMMASSKDNFEDSFERVNHLALLSAIIRDTPSSQPYLYGQTYIPLFTKWIPRFVWPGKPKEILGNTWAVKYGFLSDDDSTTSFNLPWLPEMYMNGGILGVVLVMFLLGILYRYLWMRLLSVTSGVAAYATGIVFAQSLVFAESNLSMQLGGVIIFGVFLWLLIKVLGFLGIYTPVRQPKNPARTRAAPART